MNHLKNNSNYSVNVTSLHKLNMEAAWQRSPLPHCMRIQQQVLRQHLTTIKILNIFRASHKISHSLSGVSIDRLVKLAQADIPLGPVAYVTSSVLNAYDRVITRLQLLNS